MHVNIVHIFQCFFRDNLIYVSFYFEGKYPQALYIFSVIFLLFLSRDILVKKLKENQVSTLFYSH